MVLTHHPLASKIVKIVYKNLHILTKDDSTSKIFNKPPLIAYRRDKSIGDALCRSKVSAQNNPAGSFPCGRGGCICCNHTAQDTTIQGSNSKRYEIKQRFTCNSRCLVYCLSCRRCGKLYIGETSRNLKTRFREHLQNIDKTTHLNDDNTNEDANVAAHFNLGNHSKNDVQIKAITFAPHDTIKRRVLEQKLISTLRTMNPHGLNKRTTFGV